MRKGRSSRASRVLVMSFPLTKTVWLVVAGSTLYPGTMPIHLPPISRRQFLARSLATGAGLILGQDLLGAAKETDANLWALLSDTHLAADRGRVNNGTNMADNFGCMLMACIIAFLLTCRSTQSVKAIAHDMRVS